MLTGIDRRRDDNILQRLKLPHRGSLEALLKKQLFRLPHLGRQVVFFAIDTFILRQVPVRHEEAIIVIIAFLTKCCVEKVVNNSRRISSLCY